MADTKYSIYALKCPINGTYKYVGSSMDLKQRYLGHIQSPTKATKEWINSLLDKGLYPVMDELESGLSKFASHDRERYWVVTLQKEHGTLLNVRYLQKKSPRELPINFLPKKK